MSTRTRTRAFTLIELLVVISIISLLTGMIIAMIGPIRRNAKIAVTKVRMQGVLDGLSERGQNEGSITYALQLATQRWTGSPADPEPGLGGVLTFVQGVDGLPTVKDGAWGKRGYSHFCYPWGKLYPDKRNPPPGKALIGPEEIRLRDISPFNTRKLLMVADIIKKNTTGVGVAFQEYQTDRSEKQAWNDKWGHPLVVGSAIYQPTYDPSGSTAPAHPVDASVPTSADPVMSGTIIVSEGARNLLGDAKKRYNYNRSVYIAVAAVGSSSRLPMSDPLTDKLYSASEADWASSAVLPTAGVPPAGGGIPASGNLWNLWRQVNEVCQQAKVKAYDQDWNEKSFDVPPWQGIKLGHKDKTAHERDMNFFGAPAAPAEPASSCPPYLGKDEYCLLSAPMERQ
jgi:prepilin-type N-terminal cleavage/methylation domain-containing protein